MPKACVCARVPAPAKEPLTASVATGSMHQRVAVMAWTSSRSLTALWENGSSSPDLELALMLGEEASRDEPSLVLWLGCIARSRLANSMPGPTNGQPLALRPRLGAAAALSLVVVISASRGTVSKLSRCSTALSAIHHGAAQHQVCHSLSGGTAFAAEWAFR